LIGDPMLGHLQRLTAGVQRHHRHAVHGQGAGLVHAEDLHRA
jgi:hypothetical protein